MLDVISLSRGVIHALALAPLLTVSLSHGQQRPKPAETIQITGSSTVYPFSKAAIERFARRSPKGVTIQARSVGTSAGFREFCSGKIPIAAASRPINSRELEQCKSSKVRFYELPIAFDAITVVVNPGNRFAKQISTAQLKTLWEKKAEGKVVRWSQVNPAWPNSQIKLCGPGQDSGTYDTFNKVISGSDSNSRQDYTASEDDNVLVRCVANSENALGYFGFDYYQANRSILRALPVTGLRGTVLPSVAAVQASRYLPLSRPLFYYVNEQAIRSNRVLRSLIESTLEQGVKVAEKANLIPLQDSTYRLVSSKLYREVLGSSFGGQMPIGLTIGQILERSFDAQKKPQFR